MKLIKYRYGKEEAIEIVTNSAHQFEHMNESQHPSTFSIRIAKEISLIRATNALTKFVKIITVGSFPHN
jgi:hypothetical protein